MARVLHCDPCRSLDFLSSPLISFLIFTAEIMSPCALNDDVMRLVRALNYNFCVDVDGDASGHRSASCVQRRVRLEHSS